MTAKLAKTFALSIMHNVPFLYRAFRFFRSRLAPLRGALRGYRNMDSLLADMDSEAGLQIPLLVEQNRRLYRELDQIKKEIAALKKGA